MNNVIDDNDSINWLYLKKPLSTYNQDELDSELMKQKMDGTVPTIRINGIELSTLGCDNIGDFKKKYQEILDKAGIPRGKTNTNTEELIMDEIKEEPVLNNEINNEVPIVPDIPVVDNTTQINEESAPNLQATPNADLQEIYNTVYNYRYGSNVKPTTLKIDLKWFETDDKTIKMIVDGAIADADRDKPKEVTPPTEAVIETATEVEPNLNTEINNEINIEPVEQPVTTESVMQKAPEVEPEPVIEEPNLNTEINNEINIEPVEQPVTTEPVIEVPPVIENDDTIQQAHDKLYNQVYAATYNDRIKDFDELPKMESDIQYDPNWLENDAIETSQKEIMRKAIDAATNDAANAIQSKTVVTEPVIQTPNIDTENVFAAVFNHEIEGNTLGIEPMPTNIEYDPSWEMVNELEPLIASAKEEAKNKIKDAEKLTVAPEPKVEIASETTDENINESALNIKTPDESFIRLTSVLPEMIRTKTQQGSDVTRIYAGKEFSTENCATVEDIIVKYAKEVQENAIDYIENISKDDEIKKAQLLFKLPRGNRYNGLDPSEQPKLATINEKEAEYVGWINSRDIVNLEDPEVAYNWLDELVEYVNTHALTLNLGLTSDMKAPHETIIEIMRANGYGDNFVEVKNIKDFYRNMVTLRLKELEEYHFFMDEYKELPKESMNLNSQKTLSMVEISFINDETKLNDSGIEKLNTVIERKEKKIEDLKQAIGILEQQMLASGLELEVLARTEEEQELLAAFRECQKNPTPPHDRYENAANQVTSKYGETNPLYLKVAEKFGTIISNYHATDGAYTEDETLSEEMQQKYDVRNKYLNLIALKEREIKGLREKRYILVSKNIKNMEQLKEIRENEKLEEYEGPSLINDDDQNINKPMGGSGDDTKQETQKSDVEKPKPADNLSYFERMQQAAKDSSIVDEEKIDKYHDYLSGVNANNLGYVDKQTLPNTESAETEELFNLDILDNPPLKEFTPVKTIKKISKTLYDKLNLDKYKQVLKKAIEKLNRFKVAAITGVAVAAAVLAAGAGITKVNSDSQKEMEEMQKLVDATKAESIADNMETSQDAALPEGVTIQDTVSEPVVEQPEEMVATPTLDQASNEAISNVLSGQTDVYSSSYDAINEVNQVPSSTLYEPSWENAQGGDYYQVEGENATKITPDQAQAMYENGQSIAQSVENDGQIIGFVGIDNQEAGMHK